MTADRSNYQLKLSQWRKLQFTPDSMPSVNTIKRWINEGEVDGEVIGGNYYVYHSEDKPFYKKLSPGAQELVARFKRKVELSKNKLIVGCGMRNVNPLLKAITYHF